MHSGSHWPGRQSSPPNGENAYCARHSRQRIPLPFRMEPARTRLWDDSEAGESVSAEIRIPRRALAHWAEGWEFEPGAFTLSLGFSVSDLQQTVAVDL